MVQNSIDTGKDKIQKICDALKNEAIEPAKQEAQEVLENAKIQSKEIIENAHLQAKDVLNKSQVEIEKQKKSFKASLLLAKKQAIESLKQDIEKKLFDNALSKLIINASSDVKVLKEMIVSIVNAVEKDGLSSDIETYVPKTISIKEINELIGHKILDLLKDGSVKVGDFNGGAKVSLKDKNITIDISDEALFQCIAKYVRSDFRSLMFKGSDE